jgi:hypothetical protein
MDFAGEEAPARRERGGVLGRSDSTRERRAIPTDFGSEGIRVVEAEEIEL